MPLELVRFPVNGLGRFSGGINNYLSPNLISDSEIADGRNLLLDDRGNAFSRNGSSDITGLTDKTLTRMETFVAPGAPAVLMGFTRDADIYTKLDGSSYVKLNTTSFLADLLWEGTSFGGKYLCGNGVEPSQYYDGYTFAALTTMAPNAYPAAFWCSHKARVWCAGIPGAPKLIAACKTGDVTTWLPAETDGDNSALAANFFGEDGVKILGIKVFQDKIIVLCDRNIGCIIGDGSPGTQFIMLNKNLGCLSGRTAQVYTDAQGQEMLIFWGSDGFLHAYLGGSTGDATGEEAARQFPRIDTKIDQTIRGLTKPSVMPYGFRVDTKPQFDQGVFNNTESFNDSYGNGKARLIRTDSVTIRAGFNYAFDYYLKTNNWLAQSFDVSANLNCPVQSLNLRLMRYLNPTGTFLISLRNDNGGRPGSIIGSTVVNFQDVPVFITLINFPITAGTITSSPVWVCMETLPGAWTDDNNMVGWQGDNTNPYSGGNIIQVPGGTSWNLPIVPYPSDDFDADIIVSLFASSGIYDSQVFDAGQNVTFSAFSANIFLSSGSVEYWARASDTFFDKTDPWTGNLVGVDLGNGGNGYWSYVLANDFHFQSKRYIQMRAVLNSQAFHLTTPELDWFAVGYRLGIVTDSLAEARIREGRYWLTCKTLAAGKNDTIVVLDKNSAWTLFSGLGLSCLHEHNYTLYGGVQGPGSGKASTINADDPTASRDSGVGMDSYLITKAFDMGVPDIRKDFRKVFIQYRDRSGTRLVNQEIQWSRDLGYTNPSMAEPWQDMPAGYDLVPICRNLVTTMEIPQTDRARGWLMSYKFRNIVDGMILTVVIVIAGQGYQVGDVLTPPGGTGGTLTVEGVDGTGAMTSLTITTPGQGYSTGTNQPTGGHGTSPCSIYMTVSLASAIEAQGIVVYTYIGRGAKAGRGALGDVGKIFPPPA